jgi:outer membrane protein OmpA-like peptidoglycan-associated protein
LDEYRAMSARTTGDSFVALPPEEGLLQAGTPDVEPVQPKAKAKRPRPTFDDGSITRVFKFPSKTYPRSSYYVTDTEIIIRIKKARKKWKLVVPKKRVVSYRTNRWFAKPRWIELELTYTQAAKLGLAEPRSNSKEAGNGSSALPQVAPHPNVAEDVVLNRHEGPDHASSLVTDFGTNPAADRSEPSLSADECDSGADFHHLEDDTAVAELRPAIGPENPLFPTGSRTDHFGGSSRVMSVGAASRTHSWALGLLVFVAAWTMQIDFSGLPSMDSTPCNGSEPPASCAQSIVTGSIAKIEPVPEPAVPMALTHPAPEPVANADGNVEAQNSAGKVPILDAAKPTQNLPALTTVSPVDHRDCRELNAFGRAINIQFDYASSILKRPILASLDAFASKLRSCPSAKVIIEGHTDSDGRASRNRALSLRRARVVQDHIVKAGAHLEQLTTIGLGQTRPSAPNVSTANKRSNRRAVLIVELAGSP